MNPTRQAFQCSLEHKRMRVVGSHGFGDEDDLDGQGEVPSGEVFAIGIGNNGGAYMPERVQDLLETALKMATAATSGWGRGDVGMKDRVATR